jgi:hypothetical protein
VGSNPTLSVQKGKSKKAKVKNCLLLNFNAFFTVLRFVGSIKVDWRYYLLLPFYFLLFTFANMASGSAQRLYCELR